MVRAQTPPRCAPAVAAVPRARVLEAVRREPAFQWARSTSNFECPLSSSGPSLQAELPLAWLLYRHPDRRGAAPEK
ncbi:hypothetical protein QN388_25370, partial [Pseudomonas sp. 5B4]